jgi:hypothetical protein
MTTDDRPTSRLRGGLLAMAVAALLLGATPSAAALAATPDDGATPSTDAPPPTDSEPPTSEPDDTIDTVADDTVANGDTNDGATAFTWFAVGVGTALLGVAVWWMLRRQDDDPPAIDDDWGTDSEVI